MQTYHPRYLPAVSFLLPNANKLIRFRQIVIFLVINKPVQAYLYSAVACYRINFDTSGHQHTGYFAADISFDGVQQLLF